MTDAPDRRAASRTLKQFAYELLGRNRTKIDPVAAIGLERSCPPAWHIEGSGLSTKHAAS